MWINRFWRKLIVGNTIYFLIPCNFVSHLLNLRFVLVGDSRIKYLEYVKCEIE